MTTATLEPEIALSVVLEHDVWTRQGLGRLIRRDPRLDLSRPGCQPIHPAVLLELKLGMLERLSERFLPRLIPPFDGPERKVRAVFEDWLAGHSLDSICDRNGQWARDAFGAPILKAGRPVYEKLSGARARRWVRLSCKKGYLLEFLDGRTPEELDQLGERYDLCRSRRFQLEAEIVAFASAELARESLLEQCDESCWSKGGDGSTPPDSRMTQRAKLCLACRVRLAYDRLGRLQLTQGQMGAGRPAGCEAPLWKVAGLYEDRAA